MPANVRLFEPKAPTTKFIVRNISNKNKRIKIFNYPINPGEVRDLLDCHDISEADIRVSLLKGELYRKIKLNEIRIEESNIDLLSFDPTHKQTLENAGITTGQEVTGTDELTHKILRQLIHLVGVGPMDGFANGAYQETLPVADPFPVQIIWWESSARTKKIFQKDITYNDQKLPTTIIYRVFDIDGITQLSQATDTIVYSGVFEVSRTRTFL